MERREDLPVAGGDDSKMFFRDSMAGRTCEWMMGIGDRLLFWIEDLTYGFKGRSS